MKSQLIHISVCFLASFSFHGYSTSAAEHVSRKVSESWEEKLVKFMTLKIESVTIWKFMVVFRFSSA